MVAVHKVIEHKKWGGHGLSVAFDLFITPGELVCKPRLEIDPAPPEMWRFISWILVGSVGDDLRSLEKPS